MEEYILLYGDKKKEDNVLITNMFENSKQITLGWTDFDIANDLKIIEKLLNNGINQLIFMGLEIGWDKLIKTIREKYKNIKIKVICNTQDSLLYYEYERENFFKLLQLSKDENIDDIAFLKKGQYEVYNNLGYKCSYLMQNYILKSENRKEIKKQNEIVDVGIYPLNYTWDKNIFNQLCIAKFIENSNVNYYNIDNRMKEFLDTMEIKSVEDDIKDVTENEIIEKVVKNDINISCSFTEYFHVLFFVSMEQGVPCLIGNTSDLFDECDELRKYIVTTAEDNPIINSEKVKKCIENKDKIIKLYDEWKQRYNNNAKQNIEEFLRK